MTSRDTNILLYAHNPRVPEHVAALRFLNDRKDDPDFALSEFVLVEFYNLLRNPAVLPSPFFALAAVAKIEELRANPFWTILKGAVDVSDQVWRVAATPGFPRRAIFDARLAYALAAEGVTRFAKLSDLGDFRRLGVFEVFDPLAS